MYYSSQIQNQGEAECNENYCWGRNPMGRFAAQLYNYIPFSYVLQSHFWLNNSSTGPHLNDPVWSVFGEGGSGIISLLSRKDASTRQLSAKQSEATASGIRFWAPFKGGRCLVVEFINLSVELFNMVATRRNSVIWIYLLRMSVNDVANQKPPVSAFYQ